MKPFEPVSGPPRIVPAAPDDDELEEFDHLVGPPSDPVPHVACSTDTIGMLPPAQVDAQPPVLPGGEILVAEIGQRVFVRVGGPGGEVRPAIVVRAFAGGAISCTTFTDKNRLGVDPLRNVQPHTLRKVLPNANLWAPREEDWF